MRVRTHWAIAGLLLGGAFAVGCSSNGGGGGGGTDAGTDLGPGADVRTDVPGDRGPGTDRPGTDAGPAVTNPCAMDAIVDLSSRTPGADGTVLYAGNNNRAPDMGGIPTPAMCLAGQNMPRVAHQVVHRYRMRATAVLQVSTDSKGTDPELDTSVFMATACSSTGTSLGCNDDVSQQVLQSTARTATTVMAGTDVFIVVGSYSPPVEGAVAQGTYELLINEITPTAVGQPCTGASVCATDSICIANPGSTTMGTCLADGALRGRCRLTGGACDTGLSCSVAMPTTATRGTCQRTIQIGGNCAEAGTICAMGSSCQASTPADPAVRTCVANGTQGGACRADSPRCDTGFECSSATAPTCRAAVAPGGTCDPQNIRTFCASGESCIPGQSAGTFNCAPNGSAAGTACRGATLSDGGATTPCDTGLTCSATTNGACRREVAAMGACDLRYNTTVCAAGTACTAETAGSAAGTCIAPTRETEPNNTPAMANPTVTRSTTFTGAITQDDQDCFNVTVPANASIRATTATATGTCALAAMEDTIISVYRMGSTTVLATNDDIAQTNLCSRVDGTAAGSSLNRLTAGTYAVCVNSYMGAPIASYSLVVDIFPAAN